MPSLSLILVVSCRNAISRIPAPTFCDTFGVLLDDIHVDHSEDFQNPHTKHLGKVICASETSETSHDNRVSSEGPFLPSHSLSTPTPKIDWHNYYLNIFS